MTLTKYWVRASYCTDSDDGWNKTPFYKAADVDKVLEELQAEKAQCRMCITDLKRQLREQEADLARVTAELEKERLTMRKEVTFIDGGKLKP